MFLYNVDQNAFIKMETKWICVLTFLQRLLLCIQLNLNKIFNFEGNIEHNRKNCRKQRQVRIKVNKLISSSGTVLDAVEVNDLEEVSNQETDSYVTE